MKERNIVTGISIDNGLLEEIDQRRREIGLKEGKDLPRSKYICQLLRSALENEKELSK